MVSEATNRALRTILASRGLKKGHRSQFVDLTVAEVKERNAGQTDAAMQAVEKALERA